MKLSFAHLLKRLPARQRQTPALVAPAPDTPFVAIGDVHGRADLLRELDRIIEAHHPGWPVVTLGDYIDRGARSREVLELLMSASTGSDAPAICLMGNHERMLLDFLDDPAPNAAQWLNNGGLQCLTSFSVALPPHGAADPATLKALRDRLATAMGEDMIAWLRARPLSWRSGNVWAVHAGADPATAMSRQPPEVLLWGHPAFRHRPRRDGQWVVHGHRIVDAPGMCDGRIALDTGAYATGQLSAAAIAAEAITFWQTGEA